MLRFLAGFLIGVSPMVVVWSIDHFFTKAPPGSVAKKKLQRLIERSRKLEDAKE